MTDADSARDRARVALRAFLAGTPLQPELGTLGVYAESVAAVSQALIDGGKDGAQRAFAALARRDPELARLLAEDGAAAETCFLSMEAIMARSFPAPRWVVPDLLPPGLALLHGRPKSGKSFLALGAGVAVGSGGVFLGHRCPRRPVRMICLEDSARRIQSRLRAQQTAESGDLSFAFEWPALARGGIERLEAMIAESQPALVVVDCIGRLLGRADHNDYGQMSDVFGRLQAIALAADCSLFLIDHSRKAGPMGADAIDDLQGSTGKTGAADVAWHLVRDPQKPGGATLTIRGRDLDEVRLAISFAADICTWQLVGDAAVVSLSELQQAVMDALSFLAPDATTRTIARHIERDESRVSRTLSGLVELGRVRRGERSGSSVRYILAE